MERGMTVKERRILEPEVNLLRSLRQRTSMQSDRVQRLVNALFPEADNVNLDRMTVDVAPEPTEE